ncbi:glycoside hydrolase family 13 protein [Rhypophila decipiens]|uniref:Glycoside hydrolase family 13 protein n=1 Tax=Rhypophila decipiens TaxID=261697 RepID=A0AAN6Y255_9PEZI|nr:glycoside hydrolase family 13 protein [Rhypophila decipiens]
MAVTAVKGDQSKKWWKEAIVYQVYPASFLDTNGDGRGDVNGITAKLDYLKSLGVDVVWTSPIYDSPQADMGYDIADYYNIYPPYGTLADVDNLIAELHKRDMKLVMDLVVNHTSEKHPWFLESRSSLDSPKRDWYIWKKPSGFKPDGTPIPPNNWNQILGESNSAWIFDKPTGDFYLAVFTPQQPDLNWENPAVRAAVYDILRFWLDKGVAGFRMDVINLISKDQAFPDGKVVIPGHALQPGTDHYANGPRLHEFLSEMKREVLDKYTTQDGGEIFTVGEMPFVDDVDEIVKIVHQTTGFLKMIFHFNLVDIDNQRGDIPGDSRMSIGPWTVSDFREAVSRWQYVMMKGGGWNSLYVENHDQPRSVSHFTDDSDDYREYGAKLLAIMQATLCGTLFVFQGEELGMRNVPHEWGPEEYKDVESVNYWETVNKLFPENPIRLYQARKVLRHKARDNGRTPVQWTAESPNAGFCPADVKPWMRVNDDHVDCNAEAQVQEGVPSAYHFWQGLLELRKKKADAFVYGGFDLVNKEHEDVFAFVRNVEGTGEKWVSVLNFTGKDTEWEIPNQLKGVEWLVGNYYHGVKGKDVVRLGGEALEVEGDGGKIKLRPWEGLLGKLDPGSN